MLLAVGCMIVSLLGVGGAFDRQPRYRQSLCSDYPDDLGDRDGRHPARIPQDAGSAKHAEPARSIADRSRARAVNDPGTDRPCRRPAASRHDARRSRSSSSTCGATTSMCPRTAQWIAAQRADVVVLEEVVANSGGGSASIVSRSTYPYRSGCEPANRPAPRSSCHARVLQRSPAARLSRTPDGGGLHSAGWATFGAGADALHGGRRPCAVARSEAIHQQNQTALLASRLDAFDRASLIVAGDFNSTPWSFSLRRQDALFKPATPDPRAVQLPRADLQPLPPRPRRFRILPIDQIYAGSNWKTVSYDARARRLGSDHLPTIAVLTR